MYVKSDVQTSRKENVPFLSLPKNHPKKQIIVCIFVYYIFFFDSFDVLS